MLANKVGEVLARDMCVVFTYCYQLCCTLICHMSYNRQLYHTTAPPARRGRGGDVVVENVTSTGNEMEHAVHGIVNPAFTHGPASLV